MAVGDVSLAVAVYGFISSERRVEKAGLAYEVNIVKDKLALRKCTLPVYKSISTDSSSASLAVDDDGEEGGDRSHLFDKDNEKYEKYLMKLDPNDTKNQDHYKVLGLSKLRFKATMAEIRTCYRQKVLKHHPDKKKHRGETLKGGEDYFTCITKAYEQVGMNEEKRKAYDSVDSKFTDTVPSDKTINKDNFFTELAPVFELNARWSSIQPVPKLGKFEATREQVESFYNFWFDFQTWREFSYLDEEDKERGEDRWERREMEKQNKAERERRRKEEVKRIRTLVEMAYAKDPRIVKFKKDEKEAKEKAKEERQRVIREKKEAVEREQREREEAERNAKEAEQQRLKEEKERERKEKDILKKAAAVQRKRFKKLAEEAGHWSECARDKLSEMERVERFCFSLTTDEMSSLCDRVEALSVAEEIKNVFDEVEDAKKNGVKKEIKVEEDKGKENDKGVGQWTSEEIQLLVKASNTYPSGTIDRWVVIADYINEHRKDKTTPPKNEKQVVKQCKAVQSMSLKLPASTQNQLGASLPDEDNWSANEQKILEDALKKYKSSDPDRWDKISTEIGTKSKKACIRRFKHLVQMVKNKK